MNQNVKSSNYRHILKYTGLFGGVQGLGILISLVRNKLVALILGPQGMGLIALFNSTVKLVAESTNLGLSFSAVKNISEAYEAGDERQVEQSVATLRLWIFLTAIAGMAACVVLSPLLNRWTFSWGDHTLHFIMLSPVVGLTAVTGGEMAVLKGTRHLRSIALISIFNVVVALLTSVPLYYFFGESAIVPSLIITALSQMLLTVMKSYRLYPLRFMSRSWRRGLGMVQLGVAFVAAGILGSGAEFVIRSFMNHSASLQEVGLYNAGYMMTITYAGLVFSAMETDFFPRLSAVNADMSLMNLTVNRQIEVSLLLISPMLVFFMMGLPLILPMLYSTQFLPAMDMVRLLTIALYFRALKLPVSYITLAKGHSLYYLLLEMIYDIGIVVSVVILFRLYGLTGAGIAITLTGIAEYIMLLVFTRVKYGYRPSADVLRCSLVQIPLGIIAYGITACFDGTAYWCSAVVLVLISTAYSLKVLHSKTALWNALLKRKGSRK